MKLPRVDRLDRYVIRRFIGIYLANFISFNLLFILIDGVSHFDDFVEDRSTVQVLGIFVSYYAAITPLIFCQILGPVCSVCAALFSVTTFQRSNEFIPILASGRSSQRTLSPILVASLAISLGILLIQELWVPRTVSSIRAAHQSRQRSGSRMNVKFLDTFYGNLIVFAAYDRFDMEAKGVLVIPVLRRAGDALFIRAGEARWIASADEDTSAEGHWELHNGVVQKWGADGLLVRQPPAGDEDGPPQLWKEFATYELASILGPEDLEHRTDEAVYMTLSDLARKAETAPDRSGWQVKYFSRFAYPLTNFVLVLLGIPVIFHYGNRNIFFGALLAIGISSAYFVANSACQHLAIQGTVPVRLGAGLAPIFFMALGATLYRGMRS